MRLGVAAQPYHAISPDALGYALSPLWGGNRNHRTATSGTDSQHGPSTFSVSHKFLVRKKPSGGVWRAAPCPSPFLIVHLDGIPGSAETMMCNSEGRVAPAAVVVIPHYSPHLRRKPSGRPSRNLAHMRLVRCAPPRGGAVAGVVSLVFFSEGPMRIARTKPNAMARSRPRISRPKRGGSDRVLSPPPSSSPRVLIPNLFGVRMRVRVFRVFTSRGHGFWFHSRGSNR